MPEEEVYRSSTGVDEFHYGEVGEGITAEEIFRVKFLQDINVEMPQEIVRAYGDNTTAEMATAAGDISVTSQFHKIPIMHKKNLLNWEEKDGLVAAGSNDNPPYVGVIFAKTYEDGSKEYVGLPRGMFTRPNIQGATKQGTTEFTNESISAQFMDRKVEGFDEEKSVIFAYDKPGETTNRDALFQLIFGKPHPNAEPEGA
ncbi:major tail protein [Virgibacillus kimchii]